MLKELFQKKEPKQEEIKKPIAVVNPNNMQNTEEQKQEEVMEEKQSEEETKAVNLIVSSEALDNRTFRYMLVSNKVYSIGEVSVVPC